MTKFINQVAGWINSDADGSCGFRNLKAKVDFLTEVLYHEYMPTQAGLHGEFRYRLSKWIDSASTEEQRKLMFLLLEYLFFVGQKEFEALYQTAYSRHIAAWILIQKKIKIDSALAEVELKKGLNNTIYTAITDSFKIGDFLRLNSVQGADFRFTWEQGLKMNWDPYKFVLASGGKRIVLLEDFVGSGSQMENAVIQACSLPNKAQVLLCPLIICPAGAEMAKELANKFTNLTYSPVLELSETSFITPNVSVGEPVLFKKVRKLIGELHPTVAGKSEWSQNYGPFGYEKTGALIVKHDNCPDNTLPLIHHQSDSPWHPLFYRVSRLPL